MALVRLSPRFSLIPRSSIIVDPDELQRRRDRIKLADQMRTEARDSLKPDSLQQKLCSQWPNIKHKPYRPVSLEQSLLFLGSPQFADTYMGKPVWFYYRRNNPNIRRPRDSCCRFGKYNTSYPCPICRDNRLVVDFRNWGLLNEFINPVSLEMYPIGKLGLCLTQYRNVARHVAKARDFGLLDGRYPFVEYRREYFD